MSLPVHAHHQIYHIIGNVSTDASGAVTNVESSNDASSVILYKVPVHPTMSWCLFGVPMPMR